MKAEHQKLFDAEKARADKAEAYAKKFKQSVVKGQIAQAFSAAQGLSEATDDITALALSKFSLDENGNAVAIDVNGDVIIGKDGKTPLTPKNGLKISGNQNLTSSQNQMVQAVKAATIQATKT